MRVSSESPSGYFSPDYATARARFRAAAAVAGAGLYALGIDAKGPDATDLSIDIAWLGTPDAQRIVLHSSGLHGVEAFAGSAIQLGLLDDLPTFVPGQALVLVHVLNPWGMAWRRRSNENNVDLNRNFLPQGERYSGASDHYRRLNTLLNPRSPPGFDFFLLRTAWHVLRRGFAPLQQAIACGQYEFPEGLFFGGKQLEQGPRLYSAWLAQHLAQAQRLLAIDTHTGLGRYGEEMLLTTRQARTTDPTRLAEALGKRVIDSEVDANAYSIRGGQGACLPRLLPQAQVDFLTEELGTYPAHRVLHALREENRWHHHGGGALDHPAKRRLLEALSPAAHEWREKVIATGVELVYRGVLFMGAG